MTRDAAERIINGEWQEDDLQEVARAYLSLLDNPAARVGELAKELTWLKSQICWRAPTAFNTYYLSPHDGLWVARMAGYDIAVDVTLEAAKAACELDYQNRVASLLKGEG
jgi:hypothetical protein